MARMPEEESTREIVATAAMVGMIISGKVVFAHEPSIVETCRLAFKFADEMEKASKVKS